MNLVFQYAGGYGAPLHLPGIDTFWKFLVWNLNGLRSHTTYHLNTKSVFKWSIKSRDFNHLKIKQRKLQYSIESCN